MKPLYFTLCSNNYLSFAYSLGQSIRSFVPDARFIIGLVDHLSPEIDYSKWKDFEILPCFDLGYSEFEEMLSRYNIIEFNTAVKPFYFEYLFNQNPDLYRIYYIDPDIMFYQSLDTLEREWADSEILLTPNLIYLPDSTSTGELASLRHGVNNLGFIGIQRGEEGFKFIHWWKERLRRHCRIDKCFGIFVDQKWVDLAPLFFNKIKSVKHPGWNMAWWNFTERKLVKIDQIYFVNSQEFPLVFFHFSGFKPGDRLITERLKSEEFFIADPTLKSLFDEYEKILLQSNFESLSMIKPSLKFYSPPNTLWNRIGKKIKSKTTNLIYRIFKV